MVAEAIIINTITSMFSLHNTENINIYDCEFSSNLNYDDTIHIIYSENIYLKILKFLKL